jgi:uncharacterized membrane protein HdeD (DUF308 family)
MSWQPEPDLLRVREQQLRKWWGLFLALGIAMMVLGLAAIGMQFVATITTVLVLGILLLAAGVVQIANAILARGWRPFFLHLMAGVLDLIVGGLMIERPLMAAEVLTLILAVSFVAGGSLRIAYVLLERFAGWPWVLVNGIIALLLGLLIWRQWPTSTLWVIGLLVGIELVFSGWTWVMMAVAVRAAVPGPRPLESQPPASVPAGMS